ncbi:PREDICTED: fucolectin-1-like [Gekko japonicus]|uniref:Fucolectin-1-like n=1 Tax=Gekko japonicus TaxID=146911 RepID=A0ABM1JZS3_GEKJA|nr:PREDICTED: fucolectin-1-like [Gekko japonicus]
MPDWDHAEVRQPTFERTNKGKVSELGSHALTCTHTERQYRLWWSVDLGRQYSISVVVVKNRQDCCGERIRGATIRVGHRMGDISTSSVACGTIKDLRKGSLSTIFCNGAVGRYVTIVIPGRESILTLCEVEVYGTNAPPN